jgi:hypothetical protein
MQAPVVPKRKPVMSRLSPSLGIRRAMGVPAPNIRMTRESPTRTSNAVPVSSEKKSVQGIGRPFDSSIRSQSTG